jgi:hypothetical protein
VAQATRGRPYRQTLCPEAALIAHSGRLSNVFRPCCRRVASERIGAATKPMLSEVITPTSHAIAIFSPAALALLEGGKNVYSGYSR